MLVNEVANRINFTIEEYITMVHLHKKSRGLSVFSGFSSSNKFVLENFFSAILFKIPEKDWLQVTHCVAYMTTKVLSCETH